MTVVVRTSPRAAGRRSRAGIATSVEGPAGIVETARHRIPALIPSAITERRDLAYLADLLLPLLGLRARAARRAHGGPELLLNLLSDTRTQTSIHFHYTAGALPGLMVAAALGAARLRRRYAWARRPEGRAIVVSTLVAGLLLGPLPFWSSRPSAPTAAREHVVGAHAEAARRALAVDPAGGRGERHEHLGAHLSERRRIFSFPVLGEAEWVAVDRPGPSYRDQADAPAEFARRTRRSGDAGSTSCSRRTAWSSSGAGGEPQRGIVCGSRYAVSASAPRRAARSSSSGAASGTAQARYQTAR